MTRVSRTIRRVLPPLLAPQRRTPPGRTPARGAARTPARAPGRAPARPAAGAVGVPEAVAFEAITAQLAHERGDLSHAELVAAFTRIVSDVHTQADAFDLLARVVKVAGSSLAAASEAVGTDTDSLMRTAALRFARETG